MFKPALRTGAPSLLGGSVIGKNTHDVEFRHVFEIEAARVFDPSAKDEVKLGIGEFLFGMAFHVDGLYARALEEAIVRSEPPVIASACSGCTGHGLGNKKAPLSERGLMNGQ